MSADPVDALTPLDPDEHSAQLSALRDLLGPGSRVVDIGAGLGRIAIPLAEMGCDVLAIDTEADFLEGVSKATADLERPVRMRVGDVLDPGCALDHPAGPTDAVLVLGHTLCLFDDTVACAALFTRLRTTLATDAWLALDHTHHVVWREVGEGYWQEGVSEEAGMQMVWRAGDAVIALRTGEAIDTARASVDERDVPMRLWSLGGLRLLAHASGYADPDDRPDACLTIFRPA